MAQRLRFAVMGACALACSMAGAESLPDPTRPPGVAEQATVGAGLANGPRVQLIRLGHGHASAIVDGQEVTVGSRVGDMRVSNITEGEVVLKGKQGTEVLKLFAEVEKRPSATNEKADAKASRKARK